MAAPRLEPSRSIPVLVRDLVEAGGALVRGEARLIRSEIGAAAAAIHNGTMLVATGAVLALLGMLSLIAALVLVAGSQWLARDRYWLAALILLVCTGALAVWFAARGRALLSPALLAPDQTVASLKENTEWLKHRVTSDVKSS